MSNFSLQDKTAIITGGAGGLGRAMVAAYAAAGANVVVASRTQEKIEAEAAGILPDVFCVLPSPLVALLAPSRTRTQGPHSISARLPSKKSVCRSCLSSRTTTARTRGCYGSRHRALTLWPGSSRNPSIRLRATRVS